MCKYVISICKSPISRFSDTPNTEHRTRNASYPPLCVCVYVEGCVHACVRACVRACGVVLLSNPPADTIRRKFPDELPQPLRHDRHNTTPPQPQPQPQPQRMNGRPPCSLLLEPPCVPCPACLRAIGPVHSEEREGAHGPDTTETDTDPITAVFS